MSIEGTTKDYTLTTIRFLKQLNHIVLAVVDETGRPWAVSVRIKKLDGGVIE